MIETDSNQHRELGSWVSSVGRKSKELRIKSKMAIQKEENIKCTRRNSLM